MSKESLRLRHPRLRRDASGKFRRTGNYPAWQPAWSGRPMSGAVVAAVVGGGRLGITTCSNQCWPGVDTDHSRRLTHRIGRAISATVRPLLIQSAPRNEEI